MSKPETSDIVSGFISFLIPGLGQFLQGRFLAGLIFFILAAVLWVVYLGWIIHLIAAWNAASHFAPEEPHHF